MIAIGADPHKSEHTAAAVNAQTAELGGELTVQATEAGHRRLLDWARGLDPERVWAIEDVRHVSGALERFLVAHGERVVRVAPKAHGGRAPLGQRTREVGCDRRPLDHREDLVGERTRTQNRLRRALRLRGEVRAARGRRSDPGLLERG